MTDKRCQAADFRTQGANVVQHRCDWHMNGSIETESLFRRPRQPINTNRSSENLKTSFTRFAAPKPRVHPRQLGKSFPLGFLLKQSGTMPLRRMRDLFNERFHKKTADSGLSGRDLGFRRPVFAKNR